MTHPTTVVSPDAPATRVSAVLWCRQVSRLSALVAVGLASVVLFGYLVRWRPAVQLAPGLPAMYPLTAISITVLGVGLTLTQSRRRGSGRLAVGASLVVGAIAIANLTLHILESDRTRLDLWVFDFVHPTTVVAGRPVAETGLSLLLLSVSAGLLAVRRRLQVAQVLAMAVAIGASSIVGYALDRSGTGFREDTALVGMALNTAICLFALGVSAVLARPDIGLIGRLVDGGVGGERTRRLTALVALGPLVLLLAGALIYAVAPTDEFARAAFSVVQVGVLGALVLIPAASVAATESELRQHLQQVRRDSESADDVDVVIREILADIPSAWELEGWQIGLRREPAHGHLAGDFAVLATTGARTLLAVVDAAGHDAQSAVVAYGMRTAIRTLWEHGASLEAVVEAANAKALRRRTIATGVFVELTAGTDQVRYVNAGHPAPVHLGSGLERWTTTGPLLGVPGMERCVATVSVEVGHTVVLFTDGIEEARGQRGVPLGDDPLTRALAATPDEEPQVLADRAVDTALGHTQRRLDDDVLVMVVRRLA